MSIMSYELYDFTVLKIELEVVWFAEIMRIEIDS